MCLKFKARQQKATTFQPVSFTEINVVYGGNNYSALIATKNCTRRTIMARTRLCSQETSSLVADPFAIALNGAN